MEPDLDVVANNSKRVDDESLLRASDDPSSRPSNPLGIEMLCYQHNVSRDGERTDEDRLLSRNPCVPLKGVKGLRGVGQGLHGLIVHARHRGPPLAASDNPPASLHTPMRVAATSNPLIAPSKRLTHHSQPLRLAVTMSGQMRTYQRCYESVVNNVLATNDALLFIATYPDSGEKHEGSRELKKIGSHEVLMADLLRMYGPYVATAYFLDFVAVRQKLHREAPITIKTSYSRWALFQLFLIKLAHSLLLQYVSTGAGLWSDEPDQQRYPMRVLLDNPQHAWGGFEVVLRMRPDLFVMGPVWLSWQVDGFERGLRYFASDKQRETAGNSSAKIYDVGVNGAFSSRHEEVRKVPARTSARQRWRDIEKAASYRKSHSPPVVALYHVCGNSTFTQAVTLAPDQIARSPHHPRYYLAGVPLADHSMLALFSEKTDRFFDLYSDVVSGGFNKTEQPLKEIPEHAFTHYGSALGLESVMGVGFHIMLRSELIVNGNPSHGPPKGMWRQMFQVTDPQTVECAPQWGLFRGNV